MWKKIPAHTQFIGPTSVVQVDGPSPTSLACPLWRKAARRLGDVFRRGDGSIQVIIKSFRRFMSLERAVGSVRHYYPDIEILVADDSFENKEDADKNPAIQRIKAVPGVRWIQLPFDVGLSSGKNALVAAATAEFIFTMDDDWMFTEETDLYALRTVLQYGRVDIVSSLIRTDGASIVNWSGRLDLHRNGDGNVLKVHELTNEYKDVRGVRVRMSDLGHSSLMARRSVLRNIPWDERLKITHEHMDFFLTLKMRGVRVAYTPDCVVSHLPVRPKDYQPFRNRGLEHKEIFRKKWGVKECPVNRQRVEDETATVPILSLVPNHLLGDCAQRNVVVLGVGHSGTSVVTGMLGDLGWKLHDNDPEYNENIVARTANQLFQRNETAAARKKAISVVSSMEEPWAIKDPRFVWTLIDLWTPIFRRHLSSLPVVVYLVRDIRKVEESHERRGQKVYVCGQTERACTEYMTYPGPKVMIHFDALIKAVSAFNTLKATGDIYEGSAVQGDSMAVQRSPRR